MNKRIIKETVIMSVIPLLTMIWVVSFRGENDMARIYISALGLLFQIPVVIVCKKRSRTLFQPSFKVLKEMGIKGVSCPYEPGKFKKDFKVVSVLLWLSAMAPLIAGFAIYSSKNYTIPVLNFATYQGPNMVLFAISVMSLCFGIFMLPLWIKFGQAMVIVNEISEKKRYMYMGFAEVMEDITYFKRYEKLIEEAEKIYMR